MDAPGSKIKFGFSKVIKKPNFVNHNAGNASQSSKIEIIESIEGSSMKISGKNPSDDVVKKLIIPMTNDQRTTPLSKLILQKQKQNSSKSIKAEPSNGVEIKTEPLVETLDQQAERELYEDLKKKVEIAETKIFELPMNADELPLEGAKESSLDDYDRVPIGDFGKAMLRGMGWKEEEKKDDGETVFEGPVLRPKGMGLGADKVIKKQPLLIPPTHSEKLEIKRNACVKVLAGKYKNFYGTIEGFDDGGGRVILKLAIGGLKMTLNEYMVQPISKQEFAKFSKVLNSQKYEEYKSGDVHKKELSTSTSSQPKEEYAKPPRSRSPEKSRKDRSRSREKNRHKSSDKRRDRSEYSTSVQKYRGRSRSREKHSKRKCSSSSDDYSHKKKSSKHKSKHTRQYSSPDSSDNKKKHKKKTKRSKEKRDRS